MITLFVARLIFEGIHHSRMAITNVGQDEVEFTRAMSISTLKSLNDFDFDFITPLTVMQETGTFSLVQRVLYIAREMPYYWFLVKSQCQHMIQ